MFKCFTVNKAPWRALCVLLFAACGVAKAGSLTADNIYVDAQSVRIDLSAEQSSQLAQLEPGKLQDTLALYVANSAAGNMPPILGHVRLQGQSLTFTPRFPLEAGHTYRLMFSLQSIGNMFTLEHQFSLASRNRAPKAEVVQVFPSGDALPQNLFKFYIEFSHAMSRGEAFNRIRLLNEQGEAVALPFLDIGEEFWNPDGTRFTLLFDPGRTKRGLKPNRDMGLPLTAGEQFTLVIDSAWEDAQGVPMRQPFRKTFRVTAADNDQPDPSAWILSSPERGSRSALTIQFDEPLDYALLHSALSIKTADGEPLAGTIDVSPRETHWHFVPDEPWGNENYQLVIQSFLEDRAANSVGRPFEVYVSGEHSPDVKPEFHLPVTLK